MPRRTTPFLREHYYHLYNRGNNRQPIFFEPGNYLYFLRGIKKYIQPFVSMIAYCLMPTHYHMLVKVKPKTQTSEVLKTSEVSSAEVSSAMQKFLISYTKAINKRFSRTGALFQGAFQAKLIQSYNHLLNLCIYVHANPAKDGLAACPEDWPYSNYLEWLGRRDGTLVDRDFIREHFEGPGEYQSLLTEYLRTRKLTEETRVYLQSLEV